MAVVVAGCVPPGLLRQGNDLEADPGADGGAGTRMRAQLTREGGKYWWRRTKSVTASQPERSGCELARIESSSAAKLVLPFRQRNRKPPFAGCATGGGEGSFPPAPPRRHPPGDRLDDQNACPLRVRIEQPRQQCGANRIRQFVDGVGGQDRATGPDGEAHAVDVRLEGSATNAERTIGPLRFGDRPGIAIGPDHLAFRALECPRGPGRTRPASQVGEGNDAWRRVERADDFPGDEKMQRCIEERKRRTLAGAVERAAGGETGAALDITG